MLSKCPDVLHECEGFFKPRYRRVLLLEEEEEMSDNRAIGDLQESLGKADGEAG